MKIAIAGGTGTLGQSIKNQLVDNGHSVFILSRKNDIDNPNIWQWNPKKKQIPAEKLDQVDVIINLCGAGIADSRWTTERKEILYNSRIIPTRALVKYCNQRTKPVHLINASGISYYGLNSSLTVTEKDPPANDYLAKLTQDWETEVLKLNHEFHKVSVLRISPVLHPQTGFLQKVKQPVLWGIGGIMGSGKQKNNWIHHKDLAKSVEFIISNQQNTKEIYNICAPSTLSQKQFTKKLARYYKRPILFPPIPGMVLKIMLGEMANILLNSPAVIPQKLNNMGFSFDYPDLETALAELEEK